MKSNYTRKNIIALPDPQLRRKSARVRTIDAKILQLIDNMIAAALDWEDSRPHEVAVALAAVQIGALERVIIIRKNFDDKENKKFLVLINPEIIKKEGKITLDSEGCLSVKNLYGQVPRHEKVRVRGLDITGREIRLKSPDPFIARILQHEIDHCNGICFVDHIADQQDAFSILREDGELEPYPYEKVVKMGILPDE
ncbi:peptide deformylase [Candidatus Saccharibacteria bacterium]|nr:peptide deformylase [Candidatus Saccharibacteria bacterium]